MEETFAADLASHPIVAKVIGAVCGSAYIFASRMQVALALGRYMFQRIAYQQLEEKSGCGALSMCASSYLNDSKIASIATHLLELCQRTRFVCYGATNAP